MDRFLNQRAQDPRFALHGSLSLPSHGAWFEESRVTIKKTPLETRRFNASAKKEEAKKSDASSSSSSEDEEGNKKKSSKAKGSVAGYDGPEKCWEGYKRDPKKLRGESGSCVKA
jgi:hypothetical protein